MATKTRPSKALRYTVLIVPAEEGGYVAHVPALPGCHTEADSMDEALTNAKDAIECYIAALHSEGEDVPIEPEGAAMISVFTTIHLDA